MDCCSAEPDDKMDDDMRDNMAENVEENIEGSLEGDLQDDMENSVESDTEYVTAYVRDGYQPTSRSLAEPPIFNYDEFVELMKTPSDARLKRLFRKDFAMGYSYRDSMTELGLLDTHCLWAIDLYALEEDEGCKVFYQGLRKEPNIELDGMEGYTDIMRKAMVSRVVSLLGVWEYLNLDEDGGTTKVQQQLDARSNPFQWFIHYGYSCSGESAFKKFGYLAPPGFYEEIEEYFRDMASPDAKDGKEVQVELATTGSSPSIHYASAIGSPLQSDDEPSGEQQLAMENAALKKRIAELVLENESAKRQKADQG